MSIYKRIYIIVIAVLTAVILVSILNAMQSGLSEYSILFLIIYSFTGISLAIYVAKNI